MKKILLFAFVLLAYSVTAQTTDKKEDKNPADEWHFFGESQIRTELDGRDFSNLTHPYSFTSMRTRIGADKSYGGKIFMKAVVQDTRIWGKETSTAPTTADMHNLDLHEGYVKFSNFIDVPISIQAGRFEMNYGTGRFISAVQWFWNARSFDGVKVRYEDKNFSLDAFGATLATNNTYQYISTLDSSKASTDNFNSKSDSSSFLWGLWSNTKFDKNNSADIFAYYEYNGIKTVPDKADIDRYTVGASYSSSFGEFKLLVEGAYQFGNSTGKYFAKKSLNYDVSAYTGGIKLKYDTKPIGFEAAIDILSGTKDSALADGKYHNFERPYASSLAFYGRMSYLTTSNQAFYNNCGIIDPNFRINFETEKKELQAFLHYHYLMTEHPITIVDGNGTADKSSLGHEIDFDLVYNVIKGASFQFGGGVFIPSDYMKAKWSTDIFKREDMGFWIYLGTNVKL